MDEKFNTTLSGPALAGRVGKLEEQVDDVRSVLRAMITNNPDVMKGDPSSLQSVTQSTVQREKRQSSARTDSVVIREGCQALMRWTAREKAQIIYDSDNDPFTATAFKEKCFGKSNIAVITFTTTGDVFGAYIHIKIDQLKTLYADRRHFVFSLECHGRFETPRRWMLRPEKRQGTCVCWYTPGSDQGFIYFGDNRSYCLHIGNPSQKTFFNDITNGFEGIRDEDLIGPFDKDEGAFFKTRRLVVAQLLHK